MQTKNRPGAVWVIADQVEGRIQMVSLQLVGQARKLADELDVAVEVVLLGSSVAPGARQLSAVGADCVYVGDHPELSIYQSELYTQMIVQLAEERRPEIILFGSTPTGRELAPLVAARLRAGLTAHCIDLALDSDGILLQRVPAYGGLITIVSPERRPQMATVAKGVFPTPEPDYDRVGEIVSLGLPGDVAGRVKTLEVTREEPHGVPLESAAIVVAGGAGVGDENGWREVVKLAQVLNAGLGSTRPAVDEGWTGLDTMIGQSGRMVSPTVYLGVALSGEQQHMVGIADAEVMIAINNDANAPVFKQVDYGIVDDCRQFVPLLIEKIRAYRRIKERGHGHQDES